MGDVIRKIHRTINYPAAERNKTYILETLLKYITPSKPAKMLEVASGTGQHAKHFAQHLPGVTVQPSEVDESLFDSIKGYAQQVDQGNMREPIKIDVEQGPWNVPDSYYDYILNVNMFHVSSYSCCVSFFKFASQVLKPGGLIFTYGPYAHNGVIEPQSNVNFDRNLRSQNPKYGLRDIEDLSQTALNYGMSLRHIHDLPANNKCLVWEKNQ